MGRHSDNDEDDRELFRRSVGDVRRLPKQNRVTSQKRRPAPRPRMRDADERQVLADMLSDPIDPETHYSGDEIQFARPGVQQSVLRKLRRGQYRISASLDLHGLTANEARVAVVDFLQRCRQQDKRCVRIIHGKGLGSSRRGPVLKRLVNHWLPQREEVLAFCSAPARDGGTGAAYVLLKKPAA